MRATATSALRAGRHDRRQRPVVEAARGLGCGCGGGSVAIFVRTQAIAIQGGEADYLAWAMKHYFGGITPGYLNLAGHLIAWNYASLVPTSLATRRAIRRFSRPFASRGWTTCRPCASRRP